MSVTAPSETPGPIHTEEWISSSDAVRRIMAATDQTALASLESIIAYARTGQIKARALVLTEKRFRGGGSCVEHVETDAAVPCSFWGDFTERGLWKRFAWQSGVFEARAFDGAHQLQITLTGVQFDARSLDLLAPPVPAPATALLPIPTDRRTASEWWEDLIIETSAAIYRGDLTPTRQSHIEEAMAQWLVAQGRSAAESTVRKRAAKLWRAMNRETQKAEK